MPNISITFCCGFHRHIKDDNSNAVVIQCYSGCKNIFKVRPTGKIRRSCNLHREAATILGRAALFSAASLLLSLGGGDISFNHCSCVMFNSQARCSWRRQYWHVVHVVSLGRSRDTGVLSCVPMQRLFFRQYEYLHVWYTNCVISIQGLARLPPTLGRFGTC